MKKSFISTLRSSLAWALTVALFASFAAVLPLKADILVPRGSVWKYHNLNVDLGTSWRGAGFDDSAWASGPGPLGGGDTHIVTVIDIGAATRLPTIYFRRTFTVTNASAFRGLTLRVLRDDGAIVYLNGVEVQAVNVATPIAFSAYSVTDAGSETTYFEFTIPVTNLVNGLNVLAVEGKNASSTSSDFGFDLELEGDIDLTAPTLITRTPPPAAIVKQLTVVQVNFSESVTNVDAADLLINGVPTTTVISISPSVYNFEFAQPANGAVTIAFAANHGITDFAVPPNAFAGASWNITLDTNVILQPFLISEFLAANSGNKTNSIRDEDGDSSDWIEILNPGTAAASIGGWFLTDTATNLTKWRVPAGYSVPARGYIVVFASGKDRTNSVRLHTNFQLNNSGEYLALVDPNTNVVSAFAPTYPPQQSDVSYGRDRGNSDIVGFYTTPTPGADNAQTGGGFGPEVHFSRNGSTFIAPFDLTLTTGDSNSVIRYTLVNSAQTVATATNIPTSASTLYTGPIPITTSVQVRARAFPNNPTFFPGPVHTESYIALSGSVSNFNSPLPIVVIQTLGTAGISGGFPALDNSVIVATFDNDNDTHRAFLTDKPQLVKRAGINLRGSSTQGIAKSSYAVEFWDEFNDDDSASFLGLPAESDWVLYAPNQFDPTGLHNPLMHTFAREAGQYASRTRFVEVFFRNNGGALTADINASAAAMGDYVGVYVLEEKVKRDNDRVDVEALEPEQTNAPAITGGYMFKVDRADPNEARFTGGGQSYIWVYPEGLELGGTLGETGTAVPPANPGRAAQFAYLVNYLNLFNTTLTGANLTNGVGTNHYSYYLDVPPSIDQHIVNVLTMNVDGYRLSGYFYKPRSGKFVWGPVWDVDRGLGTTQKGGDWRAFNPRSWMASNPLGASDYGTDFFQGSTPPGYIARLFTDPDFWQTWVDHYQALRATSLDTNHVTKLVDDFADEIREANPREVRRWANNGAADTSPRSGVITSPNSDYTHTFPTPGTFQGEIDFQKRWLVEHIHFMDTNLLNRPVFGANAGLVTPGTTVTIVDKSGKAGTKIFYTLDGTDPRGPQGTTNASAREYVGPISITNNVRIRARAINPSHRNLTGSGVVANVRNPIVSTPWSGDNTATFFVTTPSLRITELMYHPAPGPNPDVTDSDDYEYIELKNVGATALNLTGIHFENGITFNFTGSAVTSLAPGGYVLVVKNIAAFTSRYGLRTNIAGVFTGNLDNSGERITLVGPLGEPVLDFTYNDRWYPATDGQGFALITVNENAATSAWDNATNWRASRNVGGSPGVADPAPVNFPPVIINEVLTHTDLPSVDAIELFNTGTAVADIGGWYLTDDPDRPQKYFIPVGTTIPARGFLVFYETNKFNLGATNFALSSEGDEVYLFSATDGNLTGYSHGFDFGAAANGVSFGRYINSQGAEHFIAQAANTLGASNALPKVGPLVISEFMYHPPDNFDGVVLLDNSLDEFIELHNISGTNVSLTGSPGVFAPDFLNTWELSKAVDFKFPNGVAIPANGYALIVNFDPSNATQRTAFILKYAVPTNTPIFGPYGGKLDNSAGSIKLSRPDAQGTNGNVPYIEVDQVDYTDTAPWPTGADGIGLSLHRITDTAYGNDPNNWAGARPTPGTGFTPSAPPVITQQPQGFTVTEATSTNLSVAVSGAGPFSYQWRFNGNVLPGATSSTLAFPGILPSQSGIYSVVVLNSGGAVFSSNVTVTVRPLPVITIQPANVRVRPPTNYTFTVAASGTGPLTYQWRFNGTNIAGATSSSLLLTNVELFRDSGFYNVVVTDSIGSRLSETGSLVVLVNPVITNLIYPASVIQGRDATVTVIAGPNHPLLPLSFRWLRDGATYSNFAPATIVYTNIQKPTTIRVAITNLAGSTASSVSANVINVITNTAPDSDNDGIPDDWEIANGFSPTNAADALLDTDNDGAINRDEYIAGTNPRDPTSVLKAAISTTSGVVLQFVAQTNNSYTVEYRSEVETGSVWTILSNVGPPASAGPIQVADPGGTTNTRRFYRIGTQRLVP